MIRTLITLVALLQATLMSSCFADDRPNVVMIIGDDQAWTDFGFMGHRTVRTPRLDRLARQSALFTRGYVPSSLCRPSLMTLVTGLYPHQHKVTGNDPPRGTDRTAMLRHIRRTPTLPGLLAKRGYRSHQSGKWWEGGYRLGRFTHGMTHGDVRRGGRHGDVGLSIGRRGMKPIYDFIEQAGKDPFFLWYAPFLPHTPHNPPERLLAKYRRPGKSIHVARYQAMCQWFDETCGELLDHLDQRAIADNTLVVFVTDNGWIQRTDAGRYAPRSKRSPYDGGVRTPILLRWPGQIKPRRIDTPVSSVDLAPTILTACGLKPTDEMPGVNLLEVARTGTSERSAVFGEIFTHDAVEIDRPAANLLNRWCVTDRWKLIVSHRGEPPELYAIVDDPHEKHDLAGKHPDVVRRLAKRIERWWTPEPVK